MINLRDKMPAKAFRGEIEFIFKDRHGNIIDKIVEPNIVKIFAKEILAHRLPHGKIWDPNADSGAGAWIDNAVDTNGDFAAKYILFGASFDKNGVPLGTDDARYYILDSVTGTSVPIRLGPGAAFNGGLINAIAIAEPDRPLKRIERVDFEPTYQPSGTPLLQDDVRAMNNIVVLETTLRPEEYNGFGLTDSDSFTITEVALAGGKELDLVGACECTPRQLFLEGLAASDPFDSSIPVIASGGDVVTLAPSVADISIIEEGDQVLITDHPSTVKSFDTLDQISPSYLVLSKSTSGRDITLDRVPVDSGQAPLTGTLGMYRDTLRIFSHRILTNPVNKSSDFEVVTRWRIVLN